MEGDHLLEIKGLNVEFIGANSTVKAVDDVDLCINARECVALIGESGSGKSTIANAVLRILSENAFIRGGQILFKGRNLLQLKERDMREVRRMEISMIFQDPHSFLNPVLKIGSQLEETVKTHRRNLDRKKVTQRAIELLSIVNIPDPEKILNRYPHQLSGGMAQRVAIALALSANPALVIADEPTSALDLTIQAQMLMLMKGLRDLFDLSILLVTHDLSLVSNMAERVYVMYAGQMVEEDGMESLYRDPRHPYSFMLLEAVKKLQGKQASSPSAEEGSRDSSESGCRFFPRCPRAVPICKERPPEYHRFPSGKRVRCIRPEQ